MQVKVCGMNNYNNIEAIAALQPDYLGFIFYEKSPRCFTLDKIPHSIDIKHVGVFVNTEINDVVRFQIKYNLQAIQLHGEESISYIKELKTKLNDKVKIFKAIAVSNKDDFERLNRFNGLIDLFIFDTKTALKGGSGKQFNWDLLKYYTAKIPFLLSGGIGLKDADYVMNIKEEFPQMKGVDVNSKFEIEPGLKDEEQIKKFINILRRNGNDRAKL